MKKILLLILLIAIIGGIIFAVLSLNNTAELSKTEDSLSGTSEITFDDDYFMLQLDDVYKNYDEYENQSITLEGFVYNDEMSGYMVVGRDYYCCGDDSFMVGFECNLSEYEGEKEFENDSWVKVTGTVMTSNDVPGNYYPQIKVETIEKIEEGNKFVGI